MGSGGGHTSTATGGAEAAALAGESHQAVAAAGCAMKTRETVGQDSALEIAAKLALHEGREPKGGESVELGQESLEVFAQELVEERLGRIAAAVAGTAGLSV